MTVKEHPTHKEPIKPLPDGHMMGWKKDPESVIKNMLTPESPEVKAFFDYVFSLPLKTTADLEEYLKIWWDQLDLGSCTANAVLAAVMMVEYMLFGECKEPSRIFEYFMTRHDIEGTSGDVGATITGSVKSLVKNGVCLESTLPYNTSKFDIEPSTEAKKEALDYQTLDEVEVRNINEIKAVISAGRPVVIGFFVFDSFMNIGDDGIMPIPDMDKERLLGGHAVICIGYKTINGVPYIKIRNSWGKSWGDNGNFWMPESYFEAEYDYYGTKYACCSDFRVIQKQEYMDMGDEEEDNGDDTSQNF